LPKSITDRYPVEPDREYTVATSDFTADNQAARDQLNTTGLKFPKKGPLQRDAVIAWVRKKKKVPVEELNRAVAGLAFRAAYFFTNFLTSPRKSAPYTFPSKSAVTPSARLEPAG
jgi:hypothetical protein